jgi:hypothetical protein
VTGELELYGIMAEFRDPAALVVAARRVHEAGYKWFESYSPFPVHGLARAMGFRHTKVPHLVLLGGVLGCLSGFALQYWVAVIAYPLNIGGRPLNSWPAFIPITFETTILGASLFAVLGMLALNGLPRPHHPLFGVPRFSRVTRDAFFLCIQSRDSKFTAADTRRFLSSLEPVEVLDVPW